MAHTKRTAMAPYLSNFFRCNEIKINAMKQTFLVKTHVQVMLNKKLHKFN